MKQESVKKIEKVVSKEKNTKKTKVKRDNTISNSAKDLLDKETKQDKANDAAQKVTKGDLSKEKE